jgi:formylglycine-generating enzyme required for sulfatase activity
VLIDIQDPGVEVTVKGTTLTVTGPDKQSVKVVPGDQELTITSAGLETITKSFSLKKGDKQTVTVSIVDSKLVARLENEIAPMTPAHEEKTAATLPPVLKAEAQLPPTFKNSLGMEFVLVPKGKSWLGGGGGGTGEREVVIVNDFYLGKYEVTQEEWGKVTRTTPSAFSRTGRGKDLVKDIADAALGRFPVESVSWDNAQVFLERLNELEKDAGWVYRLPNEAEWEYACRGGPLADTSESAYDFYLDKPTNQLLPTQANIDKSLQRTCKVGSYKPNRLGLYDMHGNVWEWCDKVEKTANGTSGREPRGGGWSTLPVACKAANRFGPARWEGRVGLRVARVPVGKEVVKIPPEGKKSADAAAPVPAKTKASGATTAAKSSGPWFLSSGRTGK